MTDLLKDAFGCRGRCPSRRGRICFCAWLLLPAMLLLFSALMVFPAACEADGVGAVLQPTNRVFTTSSSGRFVVSGPDVLSNMARTRWAEETTGRLEHFLGMKFVFRRPEVIEIRLVSGREAAKGAALVARFDSGLFQRMLTVNAALPPDPDALDELLCRALVAGHIRERRRDGVLPAIPEWFTMGMAQNLNAESRVRNRAVLLTWRSEATVPGLADVIRWQTLPAGWPRCRSLCGMAIQWIGTLGAAVPPYARMLDRLADTGGLTTDWLAETLTRGGTEADMEQAWREWVGRQVNLVHSFGEVSTALIDQLKDALPLEVPSGPPGGASIWVTPREAIGRRSEPGVSFAAMQKAQRLRALTIGKARELALLGEAYARFYEHLAKGSWSMALTRELGRADKTMDQLADLTRKREAWLDVVERDVMHRSEVWGKKAAGREPVLEKGVLGRYVDEAEQKFRQRQQGSRGD